jgi:hypothetical protein
MSVRPSTSPTATGTSGTAGRPSSGATLLGGPAPEPLTRRIQDRLTARGETPSGGSADPGPHLEPRAVRVTAGGIALTVTSA